MSAEDVQLYYQIALAGRRDLPMAPEPRLGFEMTLLRMLAFRPETAAAASAGGAPPASARSAAGARSGSERRAWPQVAPIAPVAPVAAVAVPAPLAPPAAVPLAINERSWPAVVDAAQLSGMARQFALNCVPASFDNGRAHAAARSVGGCAALARHRGEARAGVSANISGATSA